MTPIFRNMKSLQTYFKAASALMLSAFGLISCQDNVDSPADNVPVATETPNTTLMELKELFWDDAKNYSKVIEDPENPDRRFIIHGTVISSDEEGNVFKSLIIQDETAALAFSIDRYNLYLNYRRGQEIVLDVTGMDIGKYSNLQQIGRKSWYEDQNTYQVQFMAPETFKNVAELNGMPDLADIDTLTVNNFGELPQTPDGLRYWQSRLVRFKNVYFEDAGKRKLSVWHTKVNEEQNTTIIDRNGSPMTVRTSGYCTFFNTTLPEGNLDIVGILSYFNENWQIILLDGDGLIKAGDRPGTKEKPYTVAQAIEDEQSGTKANGWVKGYIVGTLSPEIEDKVSKNEDIQWDGPFVISTSLVIADSPDVRDYNKCIILPLIPDTPLQRYGNLASNPSNLGKTILVSGDLTKYLDTWGLTGNKGTAEEFEIEGVVVDGGTIADGDGTENSPFNVKQVIAKNPSSTTVAVDGGTGVYVKGYIVGFMPTGGSSTILSGTVFGTDGAAETNLVMGPTPDCKEYSKCVGVQLPSAMRAALSLAKQPGNLGKELTVKGDIMKYCGGPGVKNLSEYKLGEGGDTPTPPVTETLFESLGENNTELPTGWTFDNISLASGLSDVWSWKVYNEKGYLNASAYVAGTPLKSEALAVSPVIDLSGTTSPVFSFEHAAKFQTTLRTLCGVAVREEGASAWTSLAMPTWPEAGSWSFVNSGNISLSAFAGKRVQIAFKYGSSESGADTWEIKNLKVLASGNGDTPSKPDDPTPPTPSGDGIAIPMAQFNNGGAVASSVNYEGYTIAVSQASGATPPAYKEYNGEGTVRAYADNTVTISGSKLAKIVFSLNTATGAARYTTFTPNTGSVGTQKAGDASITWTGDATTVTFTVGHDATLGSDGASKRGQIHINGIEIYPAK